MSVCVCVCVWRGVCVRACKCGVGGVQVGGQMRLHLLVGLLANEKALLV